MCTALLRLSSAFLLTSLFLPFAASAAAPERSPANVRINHQMGIPDMDDFVVAPVRHVLQGKPGKTQTVVVQLTNRFGNTGTFELRTVDFDTDPQTNQPRFFADGTNGTYSAREWIQPEVDNVTLRQGDIAFINVTVTVPEDAEPGDHQSAVVIQLRDQSVSPSGIQIVSRIAALFIISVPGEVVRDASIDALETRHALNWFTPVFFRLTASNRGTVHANPTGTIVVRNIFGVTVDEVPVRDWLLLRNSTRSLDLDWAPTFAFGRYTAETAMKLDGEKTPMHSVVFWVVPLMPAFLILLAIFIVSFLVEYIFSRFELRRKQK